MSVLLLSAILLSAAPTATAASKTCTYTAVVTPANCSTGLVTCTKTTGCVPHLRCDIQGTGHVQCAIAAYGVGCWGINSCFDETFLAPVPNGTGMSVHCNNANTVAASVTVVCKLNML